LLFIDFWESLFFVTAAHVYDGFVKDKEEKSEIPLLCRI